MTEFHGSAEREVHPFTTFINHLYVYPLSLNFDSQKLFSRARNLAVLVELRDSDAEGAKAIPVSYNIYHGYYLFYIFLPVYIRTSLIAYAVRHPNRLSRSPSQHNTHLV